MNTPQRDLTFFIVAGETSGDNHGAKLMREIKTRHEESRFIGHGGDKMLKAGLEQMYHIDQLAVMGFSEVIKHLPLMFNVMGESLGRLRELRPDRIILIDYPGFNLRLAKNCAGLGLPVTYFILPQLWAWKEKRIKSFHKYIDQSLSIFPFEQDWFENRGVVASYVGHPFTEIVGPETSKEDFRTKHKIQPAESFLLLLPGSRQQEIDRHLLVYLAAAKQLQESDNKLKILIGKAPGVTLPHLGENILFETKDIRAAIAYSRAAITTSGTASLECAVLDTPEVVCYKLSALSGILAKALNKAPFISMVNLIGKRKIVPEFVQNEVTAERIIANIKPLLSNTKERRTMLDGYSEVRRSLGLPGAYNRAAEAILKRTINA